ncbi:Crp/Fnr family transcriptional regulator [Algimonas porphyrae]|uniref:Crp/Fnr family transcriptional regulator n=1 Tax=Algimonas porphyrae TaxID=1128113 RepID=A0ABQ5V160_9PROT|nr:Crp/Fnr family transcriptional regulator [Algimonas porphyrae]GLQ21163.1 Crp/Fnr family transcriptional regulator [Algimonas porphyrae]
MEQFVRRIKHYVDVGDADLHVLKNLRSTTEVYQPGQTIVSLNEPVDKLYIVTEGWVLRARYLDDGRRQIINFLLPGDYFDLMSIVGARSDHSIVAATTVRLTVFDAQDFLRATQGSHRLASAFWWVTVQEETILRQQIVRVGRLSARERIANFILELNRRQAISSGRHEDFVPLPVPQAFLADALGLSIVHVSRSLTSLKSKDLLQTSRKGIEILDRQRLIELAEYNPALFEPHPVALAAQ